MKSAPATEEGNVVLTEWQTIRDMMKAFDDRIHDLRKYGFSFITALLTAKSLLLPSLPSLSAGNANSSAISNLVKLGVLFTTLVLVVALRQVEKVYQSYQKAANTRGMVRRPPSVRRASRSPLVSLRPLNRSPKM